MLYFANFTSIYSMETTKKVTAVDVAKFLGVEGEFKDALFEQEMKETYENFKNSPIVDVNLTPEDESTNEPTE